MGVDCSEKNRAIGCKICEKKGVITQADDIGRHMGVLLERKSNLEVKLCKMCLGGLGQSVGVEKTLVKMDKTLFLNGETVHLAQK